MKMNSCLLIGIRWYKFVYYEPVYALLDSGDKSEVDKLLETVIITRNEASWTSPVVIVTKKDGRSM